MSSTYVSTPPTHPPNPFLTSTPLQTPTGRVSWGTHAYIYRASSGLATSSDLHVDGSLNVAGHVNEVNLTDVVLRLSHLETKLAAQAEDIAKLTTRLHTVEEVLQYGAGESLRYFSGQDGAVVLVEHTALDLVTPITRTRLCVSYDTIFPSTSTGNGTTNSTATLPTSPVNVTVSPTSLVLHVQLLQSAYLTESVFTINFFKNDTTLDPIVSINDKTLARDRTQDPPDATTVNYMGDSSQIIVPVDRDGDFETQGACTWYEVPEPATVVSQLKISASAVVVRERFPLE